MQYASETHSAKFFRLFQLETPLAFYLLTSTPNLVSSLIWLFLRGLLVLRITWKKKRKESLEVFIKVQIPGCVPLTSFTCPCAVLAEEDPSHLHFEPTHPSSFWSCGPEAQLWEYLMLLKKKKILAISNLASLALFVPNVFSMYLLEGILFLLREIGRDCLSSQSWQLLLYC